MQKHLPHIGLEEEHAQFRILDLQMARPHQRQQLLLLLVQQQHPVQILMALKTLDCKKRYTCWSKIITRAATLVLDCGAITLLLMSGAS